jgi:heme/copper-type cytochrome/quinol oxidase subunit 3
VYTYDGGLGWDAYNLIETIGGYILAAGILMILVDLVWSYRRNVPAGRDPFNGGTLEWTVPSPPPHYNFVVIPTVTSAYPNWDLADREEDLRRLRRDELVLESGHETPATTVNDAVLDEVVDMPPESPWPVLIGALTTVSFFVLLLGHYAIGAAFLGLAALALVGWHSEGVRHIDDGVQLSHPNGWWGMAVFVATEATLFGTLIGTYVYLRLHSVHWPPPGVDKPRVLVPVLATALLVATSVPMALSWNAARFGLRRRAWRLLALAFVVQTAYLTWQLHDYVDEIHRNPPSHSAYSSITTAMLGADHLHVFAGLLIDAWLLVQLGRGLTSYRLIGLQSTAFYWHAVNTITVFVLLTQLSAYL